MKFRLSLFAVLLVGQSFADIPPEPPADPIPAACKPLIGIWARTTPQHSRWQETWEVLVVDSQHAAKLYYMDQKGINIEAQTQLFNIDCRPESDGTMTISLDTATDAEASGTMQIKLAGDGFTSQEIPEYDQPGAPPANWNPPPVSVTWKKVGG